MAIIDIREQICENQRQKIVRFCGIPIFKLVEIFQVRERVKVGFKHEEEAR